MSNRTTTGQAHRVNALLKLILSLMIGLMMTTLTSCAANGGASDTQVYSFIFDLRQDDQHAVILDYWYGNSRKDTPIRAPKQMTEEGKTATIESTFGAMVPRGTLYVKWRDTETQKVYEDTVDLRQRLPKNIEDHRIYLMIKGAQLYVYLISPGGIKRPKNEIPNGPSAYSHLKIVTIYPFETKR